LFFIAAAAVVFLSCLVAVNKDGFGAAKQGSRVHRMAQKKSKLFPDQTLDRQCTTTLMFRGNRKTFGAFKKLIRPGLSFPKIVIF
jgi:hypothetical protein